MISQDIVGIRYGRFDGLRLFRADDPGMSEVGDSLFFEHVAQQYPNEVFARLEHRTRTVVRSATIDQTAAMRAACGLPIALVLASGCSADDSDEDITAWCELVEHTLFETTEDQFVDAQDQVLATPPEEIAALLPTGNVIRWLTAYPSDQVFVLSLHEVLDAETMAIATT